MEWSSGGSTRISDCAKLVLSKVRMSEGVDDSANFSVNFNLLREERIYHVESKSRMNQEVHCLSRSAGYGSVRDLGVKLPLTYSSFLFLPIT